MSTPPVPPPVPNDPESGGQAPRYGQNAPQYGQQSGTPQYGQNPPQYGQSGAPQYGQNPPQYGQNPPHFGQNPPAAPGYGQQPYGQSPYAQYPSEQPQPTGSAGVPQLVNISFWLLIAAAAIFVISMLTGLTTLDDPMFRNAFEDQIEGSGAGVTYEDMKGVIAGTLVVFAIIGLALYLLVAFFVRKGKNWARILGTVFAALSVFSLFGPPSFATIGTLLGIAAIVLLYLPAAAPYFRRQQPFGNPYGSNMGNPYGR
ncbi:hypothetical protein CXX84_18440 [Arthrobacter sp. AFG7.2]|uniref:hypothetical protein n=1 Tax=Arthrobacter sp. AFG7.2 TaxID=1688693 RepID=UPI000C9EB79D|nr:hypothetical protein [Arthrobacter sp. AFG7.2]PNI07076.1 hypothetical protein CXX84_18440 [Arthrobacter sp. AFG7.2]